MDYQVNPDDYRYQFWKDNHENAENDHHDCGSIALDPKLCENLVRIGFHHLITKIILKKEYKEISLSNISQEIIL